MEREVRHILPPMPSSDGAGVRLDRYFPVQGIVALDPFLLLDAFGSDQADDYIAGFPPHPHRGFETVTYMLDGLMRHKDSAGNGGVLGPGGVQWMTAGRGIVHEEMPAQTDGRMRGFQLWVNLPAKDKMTAPRYQNIEPAAIPVIEPAPGVTVKVIAGRIGQSDGAVNGIAVDPLYVDITLQPDASWSIDLPAEHTALAVLIEGAVTIGATRLGDRQVGLLGDGERITLTGVPDGGGRLLIIAGRPLHEPIARYGPFVMNTRQEVLQAVADYEAGRF